MSKIKLAVDKLEKELSTEFNEYVKQHDELKKYTGKQIGDNVEIVNQILYNIQQSFEKMYPALHYIGLRHQFVINITNEYEAFIESLKKSGAQEFKGKTAKEAFKNVRQGKTDTE